MRTRRAVFTVFWTAAAGLFLLLFFFSVSARFAAGFDAAVGVPLRHAVSTLSSLVPFSLTELLLLLLPLFFAFMISTAFYPERIGMFTHTLFLFLLLLSLLFGFGFAAGGYRPPLEETLGLSVTAPTAEEVADCTRWVSGLATYSGEVPDDAELSRRLLAAFRRAEGRYGIPVNTAALPKSTATPLLSHLGYFGLYAFPLGEITVTAECPAAVRAFTAAHELAHASGLRREEEADAFAFLVCLDSGDPYLSYAAATGVLGRLLTEMKDEEPLAWQNASSWVSEEARRELLGAGELLGDASETVALPTPEYDKSVRLLCALYRSRSGKA